jgi:hypothetical protein
MTDQGDPFNSLDLQEAIDLRWTLRDIRAKRWKLSPISPSHLEKPEIDELDRYARRRAGTDDGRIRCPSLIMAPSGSFGERLR